MTDAVATFRVLHVCTGNICRSPLAEHLMRRLLEDAPRQQARRVAVESAGTWGHTGSPMEAHARTILASYGIDGGSFRARELEAEHVAAADLVLGASREHRAAAVVLRPDAADRTFTLRELARLSAGISPADLPDGDIVERARALVRAAAARRGLVPPGRPSEDDVADPYLAPASAFAACAEQVRAALQAPLALLTGAVDPPLR